MTIKTLQFACIFALVSLSLQSWSSALAGLRPEATNRVVIILDGSGSFSARQTEALDKAKGLLREIARTKLHRWETGGDEISIIDLDAVPEVIWRGNLKQLKAMDKKAWTEHIKARSRDFSMCTDVGEAFRLAVQELKGDPRYVSKYLLVFSDLINEPPTSSVYRCQKADGNPPAGFPWRDLKDVSVAVFWMPPNQVLTWRRAVRRHGLERSFVLYSGSESAKVAINPPPHPEVRLTKEDREKEKERHEKKFLTVAKWIGSALAIIIALVITGAIVGAIARKNRRQGA